MYKFSDNGCRMVLHSQKVATYSRDVDGSALIINDTAYLGLRNGLPLRG